jgi:DNA-3-methyladenine glycosylase I
MSSYCEYAEGHDLHGPYHDREYGFPIEDESRLFERLLLEINQAGLNWELILKKREGFREAYDDFDVDRVADYGEQDRERLLADARIIRNKLKVNAAIVNANVIRGMRGSHGGFAGWLKAHHPLEKDDWVKLFKKTFKFTGGEITGEFLMSIGYLPCPHREDCPVYTQIVKLNPPWMDQQGGLVHE